MASQSQPSRQFLNLINQAYDTPLNPDKFDELMVAAKQLFAPDYETEESQSPIGSRQLDKEIHPHIERIQTILDAVDTNSRSPAPQDTAYAKFTVSQNGDLVDGNEAASNFFETGFPCRLAELDLDRSSQRALEVLLRGEGDDESVIRIVTDNGHKIAFAFCHRSLQQSANHLRISLSYIEWTDEVVDLVSRTIDLTISEKEVLIGTLKGKNQSQIAKERERSIETIRAQAKSILRKSGCARMSDLAHLAASVAFFHATAHTDAASVRNELAKTHRTLKCSDGRTVAYQVYGPATGRPVVFVHGSLLGPFFTPQFLQNLSSAGITLYCPSRPGFGETTAVSKQQSYEQTAVNDLVAICDREGIQDFVIATIHGGVSHAYRAAQAFGDQVKGLVMIGAGIPISESEHLPHMDRYTRIAAATVKHAPSLLELITRIAISTYRRRGYRKFFEEYFAGSPVDTEALKDQEIYHVLEQGLHHLICQGPQTFVVDGKSQMADWEQIFNEVNARSLWLHAEDDPIMPAHFVQKWVTGHSNHPVEIVPSGGYNLIHTRRQSVEKTILEALSW